MALPLNKAIMDLVKVLWQTTASLTPTAKCTECKYFVPSKGYKFLLLHTPLESLVIVAANERDHQGQVGPEIGPVQPESIFQGGPTAPHSELASLAGLL